MSDQQLSWYDKTSNFLFGTLDRVQELGVKTYDTILGFNERQAQLNLSRDQVARAEYLDDVERQTMTSTDWDNPDNNKLPQWVIPASALALGVIFLTKRK